MQNLKYAVVAFLAGAAGAVVGVLAAPASGRETRRRLSQMAREEKTALVRKGHRAVEGMADYLQDQLLEGRRKLARVVTG